MMSHDTLLIASGAADARQAIKSIFEDEFNILESFTPGQTLMLLKQNSSCIAALILDISRGMDLDMELLRQIRQDEALVNTPVIALTDPNQPDDMGMALLCGATEAMSAEFQTVVLQQRVRNITELYRHKWHLEELAAEQAAILQRSNDAMVDVLSSIIEYRSVESGQHILRIRRYTQILLQEIARTTNRYHLDDQLIRIISSASALHDIGKIHIPDAVLNKPGKLNREEWAIMKQHAQVGSQIVKSLGNLGDKEYLRYAYNICLYHHERWDGGGYPHGISGDQIPVCAQVVGLADAYDALTTKRVYKDAVGYDIAIDMICRGECGAFSPLLLECFKNVAGQFMDVAKAYADGLSPKAESFDVSLPLPTQPEEMDALQRMRGKYQMLLHYMDATVIEADLEQGIYHVVYNPDPDLAILNAGANLAELDQKLRRYMGSASDWNKVMEEVRRMMAEGLLRVHCRLPIQTSVISGSQLYDLTILRQQLTDKNSEKVLIIWEKAGNVASLRQSIDDYPSELLPAYIQYANNRELTILNADEKLHQLLEQENIGGSFLDLVAAEDRAELKDHIYSQLRGGKMISLEFRACKCDGTHIWLHHQARLQIDSEGREVFTGILLDITESMQEQQHLKEQLQRQQIILSQTENVLYDWDLQKDILTFSDSWEPIFGYPPVEGNLFKRMAEGSRFHPEDVKSIYDSLEAMRNGEDYQVVEVRIAKADGRYLWCRMRSTGQRDEDGNIQRIVGVIINIDDEKRSAQELKERAERDVLTKLLNKAAARHQAEAYIENFAGKAQGALVIIDLDNFKYINDRFGHMFGDAVLLRVAREIRRLFRSQDIVARIGGDEFMVVMRGVSDQRIVENRCRQLLEVLRSAMADQLRGSRLSCSIGIALMPKHGSSYEELFRHADNALYWAKDRGKNCYAVYDSEADNENLQKLATAVNAHIDSDDQSSLANSNIVQYAFQHLYQATDVEESIREILGLVGRQINVSRVYIFENNEDNTESSNTFEWCNEGVAPEIQNLQHISYDENVPNLLRSFDEHGIFYSADITQLPMDLYEILEQQGIKSILLCAIRDHGIMRGYIGFDECQINRYWTREQVNMLSFFAEMLSVFLMKKRTDDAYRKLKDQ